MQLRLPTVDDLSTDFSAEIGRFRHYWEAFNGKVVTYRSPRTGRKLRKHTEPTYDVLVLGDYLKFLEHQLGRPELQFRSLLREVLEVSYAQKDLYKRFITSKGSMEPGFAPFHKLDSKLRKHLALAALVRKISQRASLSLLNLWETMNDPEMCLALLESVVSEPAFEQHSGMRLFCAECHHLEGGPENIVEVLRQYQRGLCGESALVELRSSLLLELKAWSKMVGTHRMDHDAYFEAERWRAPIIDACATEISWQDLCETGERFIARLTASWSSHKVEAPVVADLLRRCVPFKCN